MAEIADLQTNDNNNVGRFPEGQTIPSINNGARALEGLLARYHRDTSAVTLTSGSNSAYAIAPTGTYPAHAAGIVLRFRVHVACAENPTITIGALAAKPLRRMGNRRVRANDLVSGQVVEITYNTAFDSYEVMGLFGNWQGSYSVASLPTTEVVAGDMAYATNGRKNGEGAGVGTGVLVFWDATAWRAVDTGATVAA